MKKTCVKCGTEITIDETPNEFTDSIAKECEVCGKLIIFRRGEDY